MILPKRREKINNQIKSWKSTKLIQSQILSPNNNVRPDRDRSSNKKKKNLYSKRSSTRHGRQSAGRHGGRPDWPCPRPMFHPTHLPPCPPRPRAEADSSSQLLSSRLLLYLYLYLYLSLVLPPRHPRARRRRHRPTELERDRQGWYAYAGIGDLGCPLFSGVAAKRLPG